MSGLDPSPRRALGGYTRLVGLLLVLAAVTVFVPSTGRQVLRASSRAGAATGAPTVTTPGADAAAGAPVAGAPGRAGGTGATGPGGQPASAPGGSACPDRSAQIPGDPYSPACVRFSGSNGGATTKGVTGDTIKVTWRISDDAAAASAAQSIVGSGVKIGDSREDAIRTLKGLVDYMNAHFQLYGRKLELEIYDGLGSNTTEASGAGQDQANADAVTAATKLDAFADASAETAVYTDALARRNVISVAISSVSDEWYAERHPYAWGALSCTDIMRHMAEYANKRLFGRPATDAGEGLAGKPRRIALLAPENTYFQDCAKRFIAETTAAGNHMDDVLTYALDLNTLSQDTSSMIARLSQDQITSVILFTDPVSPLFLTAKATQQRYFPEWIVTGLALTDDDRIAQLYDQSQWQHAFGLRTLTASLPKQATIPYAAFKSVHPDQEPAGIALLFTAYERLYNLAAAIQQAGPNLTPETFATGWQAYRGGNGFAGIWRGRPGSHTLQVDTEEAFWDAAGTSAANGGKGTYVTTSPRLELGQRTAGPPTVAR